jgi:two-component system OmpR family response regulator
VQDLHALVVEDDPDISSALVETLEGAGFRVTSARDGRAAVDVAAADPPDLVTLDLTLPHMDGIEVCRRIRAKGELPILFLSSRDEEIDRVLGIELGADDYVVKPFSPREVTARVQAILRRTQGRAKPVTTSEPVSHGRLTLDPEGWRAQWDGQEAQLTVSEFNLLQVLARSPTRVFSREVLIDNLHGPGFAITDRTIDSHVRNLRAKFAAMGATDVIETRAGVGYRLGPCRGGGG